MFSTTPVQNETPPMAGLRAETALSQQPGTQAASAVMMVRPRSFRSNEETRSSNAFQRSLDAGSPPEGLRLAQQEFDVLVLALQGVGIQVEVFEESPGQDCPDALFPNNWVSFHASGRVILYPLMAPNRRRERRRELLQELAGSRGFVVRDILDLTHWESQERFLEGTGSLVLDRVHRIAYACLSRRTHQEPLQEFCQHTGYRPVTFQAFHEGLPVYHTNVLMSLGSNLALLCSRAVEDSPQKQNLLQALEATGKEVLHLGVAQMTQFLGNALELRSPQGPVWALSSAAFGALGPAQRRVLEMHGQILHVPLPTIEQLGGGSCRCLLAELFLPQQAKSSNPGSSGW